MPYEHKRGRCRRKRAITCGWRGRAIASRRRLPLLLEEWTGKPINEAHLRYHADGVTVRMPIDEAADVRAAVARARIFADAVGRPVAENEKLCRRCSLGAGLFAEGGAAAGSASEPCSFSAGRAADQPARRQRRGHGRPQRRSAPDHAAPAEEPEASASHEISADSVLFTGSTRSPRRRSASASSGVSRSIG